MVTFLAPVAKAPTYVKVTNFPGLYRHARSGRYYACKKQGGIVADIRAQVSSPHAEVTGDFVEFLGLAGLGQAEASSLTWGDVDRQNNRLNIRRHKTDTHFHVPIYDHLRPLLVRLNRERRGKRSPASLVLKILDAKRALMFACQRLK